MSQPAVCVITGVSGFIASNICKQLLENTNHIIRGTVRDPTKLKTAYPHLEYLQQEFLKAHPNDSNRLTFFAGDLNVPGSFDEVIKGADYVFHIASPYYVDVKDPKKELLDPAVNGTKTVLEACAKARVKKVVLTSSLAAIHHQGAKNKVYTEKDWNTKSSLQSNPYYLSKVEAEKTAWRFVQKLKAESKDGYYLKLAVINPAGVNGPALPFDPKINQSIEIISTMLKGELYKIDLATPWVDVRDIARAHINVMFDDSVGDNFGDDKFNKDSPEYDRFLVYDTQVTIADMVPVVEKNFPQFKSKLPHFDMSGPLGTFITTNVLATILPMPAGKKNYIKMNVGKPVICKSEKYNKKFNEKYVDTKQSLIDTVQSLIDRKLVKPSQ